MTYWVLGTVDFHNHLSWSCHWFLHPWWGTRAAQVVECKFLTIPPPAVTWRGVTWPCGPLRYTVIWYWIYLQAAGNQGTPGRFFRDMQPRLRTRGLERMCLQGYEVACSASGGVLSWTVWQERDRKQLGFLLCITARDGNVALAGLTWNRRLLAQRLPR